MAVEWDTRMLLRFRPSTPEVRFSSLMCMTMMGVYFMATAHRASKPCTVMASMAFGTLMWMGMLAFIAVAGEYSAVEDTLGTPLGTITIERPSLAAVVGFILAGTLGLLHLLNWRRTAGAGGACLLLMGLVGLTERATPGLSLPTAASFILLGWGFLILGKKPPAACEAHPTERKSHEEQHPV